MDLLDRLLGLDREMALETPMACHNYRHTRKLDVLVVDDDHLIRQTVATLLSDPSLHMYYASNAAEAVEAYIARPPHMIFLDIEMPDVNGLDLLKIIMRHHPEAYPIMLTGDLTPQHVTFARDHGAKGYVGKPFTRKALTDCVERYLSELRSRVTMGQI